MMESEMQNHLQDDPCSLSQCIPVHIQFNDLSYWMKGRNESKQILKSINGSFYPGELTAILGSSGSGKTTLLNILSGCSQQGVSGSILINGEPRQMKHFHEIKTYIMQEDYLQPHLTIKESMLVAAALKLGNYVDQKTRLVTIKEVLSTLRLESCSDTRVENLSGGEKKRLAIALEIVSNPPVIFLDEPMSGLDTVAIKQCLETLEMLARQGRTVVCTIHQPSGPTFQKFHQVYFLAEGQCVYNGSTSNIIPFLSSVNLHCPITHSPPEFSTVFYNACFRNMLILPKKNKLLKIVARAQPELFLINLIFGLKYFFASPNFVPIESPQFATPFSLSILLRLIESTQISQECLQILVEGVENGSVNMRNYIKPNNYPVLSSYKKHKFAASFWLQFSTLYCRMMLQARRNKTRLWIQSFSYMALGLTYGLLLFGIGNNAELAMSNFKYYMYITFVFMYMHMFPHALLFPFEFELLKREYFNRWHGLKSYFLALILRNIPTTIIFGLLIVLITYTLTSQPLEWIRFFKFCLVCLLVAIASEGLGLAIGSICSPTSGAVAAPGVSAPCVFLGIYGMGYGTAIERGMKIAMYGSYLRFAIVGLSLAMFDDRPQFYCSDEMLHCFYKDPKHVLRDLGMQGHSYWMEILGLSCFTILFQLVAFFSLRYRLSTEFAPRLANFVTKILQYK